MSFSDELRTWPFSSKKVGKALLAHWADKAEALEAENERLRKREQLWKDRVIFEQALRMAALSEFEEAVYILRDVPFTETAKLKDLCLALTAFDATGYVSKGDWEGVRKLWLDDWVKAIKEGE